MSSSLKDMYISSELVRKEVKAKTDTEALEQMSALMIEKEMVEESFTAAVKEREKEFPTGLKLEHIGVAIPHTDSIHVRRQSMAIGLLKEPVRFRMMGGDVDDFVDVRLIFMLAIIDPKKQIEFLQALVSLMQDDQEIIRLLELESEEEVVRVFKNLINGRE